MSSTSVFTETLATAAGSFSSICQLTASDTTTFGVYLSVVESASLERIFRFSVPSNATGSGTWRRLVPIDKTEKNTTWGVDIQSVNAVATLRIVRLTTAASTTSLNCKVTAYPAPGKTVTIAGDVTTGTGATNAGTYDGALLTQVDGKVGINTEAPAHDLDVAGNTNTSGVYKIGGADVLTSSALGSSIVSSTLSSVGTLSSLNVNGSVNLTGLTQNTQPGNVVYINTGTGQLHFGPPSSGGGSISGNVTNLNVSANLVHTGLSANLSNLVVTGSTTLNNPLRLQNLPQGGTGNALYIDTATGALSFGGGFTETVTQTYDASTWGLRTSAADNDWLSIAYGNNVFVAISSSGSGNRVMTSPDGITWTIRSTPADNAWRSVCFGNGLFIAVADNGIVGQRAMSSPDGITWTLRSTPQDYLGYFVGVDPDTGADIINYVWVDGNWNSVAYGNGRFVGLSYASDAYNIMVSTDGVTWSATDPNMYFWTNIVFGNGSFIGAHIQMYDRSIRSSADGGSWTVRYTPPSDATDIRLGFGNGLFVGIVLRSSNNPLIVTSLDGISWIERGSVTNNNWTSVTHGSNVFVAVANSGTGNRVMTSQDGIAWSLKQSAANQNWNSVAHGNGRFVAVSSSGTGQRVMTSNVFAGNVSTMGLTNLAISGNIYANNIPQFTTANNKYVAVNTSTGQLSWNFIVDNPTSQTYVNAINTGSSTTSTTYQEALILSNIPAGTYLILADAMVYSSHTGATINAALTINGTVRTQTVRSIQVTALYDQNINTTLLETFASATTVRLVYCSGSTSHTAYILTLSLCAIRIA